MRTHTITPFLFVLLFLIQAVFITKSFAQSSSLQTNGTLCLDVHWSDYVSGVNGGKVQVWGCNFQGNQSWNYDSRTRELRLVSTNTCLDVDWADWVNRTNGGKIQTWACNGQDNQKWRPGDSPGRFVSENGMCLDVHWPDWVNRNNGGKLQLWDCNNQSNQTWSHSISDTGSNRANVPPKYDCDVVLASSPRSRGRTFVIPTVPERGVVVVETFIPDAWVDTPIPGTSGKGDGRGHDIDFDPHQTRAYARLDFQTGTGCMVSNWSQLRTCVFGRCVHKTFTAHSVGYGEGTATSWITASGDSNSFEYRYHLPNSVPLSDWATCSIDHIFRFDSAGNLTVLGDRFPSLGVYQYPDDGGPPVQTFQFHANNIDNLCDFGG